MNIECTVVKFRFLVSIGRAGRRQYGNNFKCWLAANFFETAWDELKMRVRERTVDGRRTSTAQQANEMVLTNTMSNMNIM